MAHRRTALVLAALLAALGGAPLAQARDNDHRHRGWDRGRHTPHGHAWHHHRRYHHGPRVVVPGWRVAPPPWRVAPAVPAWRYGPPAYAYVPPPWPYPYRGAPPGW